MHQLRNKRCTVPWLVRSTSSLFTPEDGPAVSGDYWTAPGQGELFIHRNKRLFLFVWNISLQTSQAPILAWYGTVIIILFNNVNITVLELSWAGGCTPGTIMRISEGVVVFSFYKRCMWTLMGKCCVFFFFAGFCLGQNEKWEITLNKWMLVLTRKCLWGC